MAQSRPCAGTRVCSVSRLTPRTPAHPYRYGGPSEAGSRHWLAWAVLYGLILLYVGGLGLMETVSSGSLRIVIECLATLLFFGLAAVWLRANRPALALCDLAGEPAARTASKQQPEGAEPRVVQLASGLSSRRKKTFGRVRSSTSSTPHEQRARRHPEDSR